jgi:hypothetical protein
MKYFLYFLFKVFLNFRILHMNGFTETDIINYRFLIYSNVIEAMHQFLEGARILQILIDLQVQVNFFSYKT